MRKLAIHCITRGISQEGWRWQGSGRTVQPLFRVETDWADSRPPAQLLAGAETQSLRSFPYCLLTDLLWLLGPSVYLDLPWMRINSGARMCPAHLPCEQRRRIVLSSFLCHSSCHLRGLPLLTRPRLFPLVSHEPRPSSLHLSRHQLHVNGITQAAFPSVAHT